MGGWGGWMGWYGVRGPVCVCVTVFRCSCCHERDIEGDRGTGGGKAGRRENDGRREMCGGWREGGWEKETTDCVVCRICRRLCRVGSGVVLT